MSNRTPHAEGEADLSAVQVARLEAALARYDAPQRPGPPIPRQSYLLEALHDAQEICGGWLPRPALERISDRLQVPAAEVYGVTEFYSMFYTCPVGDRIIRVCQDGPCAVTGADALMLGVCGRLGVQP